MAHGGVWMGKVEAVRGKHLTRGDARDLQAGCAQARVDLRDIDLRRVKQREFDPVEAQVGAPVNRTAQIVAKNYECAREGAGRRYCDAELHFRAPAATVTQRY